MCLASQYAVAKADESAAEEAQRIDKITAFPSIHPPNIEWLGGPP
jgi:hypothetical protein